MALVGREDEWLWLDEETTAQACMYGCTTRSGAPPPLDKFQRVTYRPFYARSPVQTLPFRFYGPTKTTNEGPFLRE